MCALIALCGAVVAIAIQGAKANDAVVLPESPGIVRLLEYTAIPEQYKKIHHVPAAKLWVKTNKIFVGCGKPILWEMYLRQIRMLPLTPFSRSENKRSNFVGLPNSNNIKGRLYYDAFYPSVGHDRGRSAVIAEFISEKNQVPIFAAGFESTGLKTWQQKWSFQFGQGTLSDICAPSSGSGNISSCPSLFLDRDVLLSRDLSVTGGGDGIVPGGGQHILHIARLSGSKLAKTGSCPPQGICEYAKRDSGNSDQRSLIFISKMTNASGVQTESKPIDFRRLDENAITFLKALVLFGILAIMYAMGKFLGLVEYKNYDKEHRSGNENRPE